MAIALSIVLNKSSILISTFLTDIINTDGLFFNKDTMGQEEYFNCK